MIRTTLIVLFGAIPASFLCIPLVFGVFVYFSELLTDPSVGGLVPVLVLLGGMWGTLSLWGVVASAETKEAIPGLLAGIVSVCLIMWFILSQGDESRPYGLIPWAVSPVLVAVALLAEHLIQNRLKESTGLKA